MKHNQSISETSHDWHPAQIVCALNMAGWTLRKLSVDHGYHPAVLSSAIQRRWPKGEKIIAETLGLKPEEIWPSRYAPGQLKKRGRKSAVSSLPKSILNEVDKRIDDGHDTVDQIHRWLQESLVSTEVQNAEKVTRYSVARYARLRRKQRSVKNA